MTASKSKLNSVIFTILTLSAPAIIEHIMSTLLQYVDTAMVGHLGEQATAAVSITTTITWLIGSAQYAAGTAFLALIAKAVGANHQEQIQKDSSHALFISIVIGVVLGGISIVLSPFIPIWMGAEKTVQKSASIYFLIISIPMIFRAMTTILGCAIRATKDTRTPMYIGIAENVLNILLNYLFIYVFSLGVIGAAIGSAVSYTASGLVMLVAFKKNSVLYPACAAKQKTRFKPDSKVLKECAKIGLPLLATNCTSCLGYVFFAALVSSMGTVTFAAHSIAVTAESLFYTPGHGLSIAISTLCGNALGERDEEKLKLLKKGGVIISTVLMCVSGAVLYFTAYPLMCLFTTSQRVALLGSQMLKLVAFSEPFFGLKIILEGIYNGLGKTKYPFYVETFSMWCIRILFTFFCVKIWHLDLQYVWYCMIADNVFKALVLLIPLKKYTVKSSELEI